MRAVLFDLDGTLLDRRETFRRHLELQIQRHLGMFPDAQAAGYVAQLLELDENGMLDRAEFYGRVEDEFGLARGSAAELSEDFEVHFPESCVPFPNLFETLQTLRDHGLKLGLVTNGRELIQGRKIERLGIRPYLDAVVISETVGTRKPDPRIFSAAPLTWVWRRQLRHMWATTRNMTSLARSAAGCVLSGGGTRSGLSPLRRIGLSMISRSFLRSFLSLAKSQREPHPRTLDKAL